MIKLPLKNVTLWAASWSSDAEMHDRTLRVLCYCRKYIEFERIIHFSAIECPFGDCPWETIIIPKLDFNRWNLFVNRVVPNYIQSEFAMSVHEDGFPIEMSLWKPEFLEYDYIGAPWADGVVGNGGFNIESQKLLKEKLKLSFVTEELTTASDMYICRNRKQELEAKGITFAPRDIALQFSTELIGEAWPSFGYHGRIASPNKHRNAWARVEISER